MTSAAFQVPRRAVTGRRPEMAARLLDAAVEEVAETGFEGMTVRLVAARASVSVATAYSYFSSKEHLLTSEFWRRLTSLAEPEFEPQATLAHRVVVALEPVALLVADEPELAAGVTTSMLAHDADVTALRDQIGAVFARRVELALGPQVSAAAAAGLTMTFVGALLSAGMGNLEYRDIPGLLGSFAALLQAST
jgi:AcrR family transcriptional regulator